jgi:hypothetical protein
MSYLSDEIRSLAAKLRDRYGFYMPPPVFATYDGLKKLGCAGRTQILERVSTLTGKTVFLSHATADDDLVAGAIVILETRTRIEREANRIQEKLRAEVAQESERHKGSKRKRPFESQLTMLFAVHFVANG